MASASDNDVVRTGHLFAPLHAELISVLRSLPAEAWLRPTVAGKWRVRDVAAHLLDVMLRRLSSLRDGHSAPPPAGALDSYSTLVAFINKLNADWVTVSERLSTTVITDLLDYAGSGLAPVLEAVDPMSPAAIPVAWAGENESLAWMDIGREYTEHWHHQQQIRDAVGAPLLLDERWMKPLLELSVRALPHAYRDVSAPVGTDVSLVVGERDAWTLRREALGWVLTSDFDLPLATCTVRMGPDTAWRLFYNALAGRDGVVIEGDSSLAAPLLKARSVMV